MKLRITLLVVLIILTLTAVQYGLTTNLTQASEASAIAAAVTTTPESSGGDTGDEHDQMMTSTESISGTVSIQEQIFQVTVATYLMDTAGFHAMDERLNQEGVIEAGDAGVVNRVNGLLAVTAWPEELQAQVDPLKEALSQYAEALANDDVEAAKPLATQTHELQHDLSHAVEHWVGEMTGTAEPDQEHDHSEESGG
jgi:hypothetical protein